MTTAVEAAERFVHAVAWGEHHTVWELLGREGRRTVLRIATERGMDDALSARLRDGTAARSESESFLTDLINGLRADLLGANLDAIVFLPDPAPEPGRARVIMSVPFPEELGQGDGVPVGSIELTEDDGQWKIERLLPRPGVGPGPVDHVGR